MGGRDPGRRTRALGTRDRVLSYLADGEISDPKGMASTVLAEAVGYPGSSAAFAQLLSGMERSGLIEREIRGKRTYRIAAPAAKSRRGEGSASGNRPGEESRAGSRRGEGSASGNRLGEESRAGSRRGEGSASGDLRDGGDVPGSRRGPGGRGADSGPAVTAGRGRQQREPAAGESDRPSDLVAPPADTADFDYDELARRLLVQVVRMLAVSPGTARCRGTAVAAPRGPLACPALTRSAWSRMPCSRPWPAWSRSWPASGPGSAGSPRRMPGCASSYRPRSRAWPRPRSGPARPGSPGSSAARSSSCWSACCPRPGTSRAGRMKPAPADHEPSGLGSERAGTAQSLIAPAGR